MMRYGRQKTPRRDAVIGQLLARYGGADIIVRHVHQPTPHERLAAWLRKRASLAPVMGPVITTARASASPRTGR